MTQKVVNYLNSRVLPGFEQLTGVNVTKPGNKVPESGGVPRLFILDEDEPGEPMTLAEKKAEVGSVRFWELVHQGRVFAYPSGQKEPVQVQLKLGDGSPTVDVSEPLSTQEDRLASLSFRFEKEAPKPKKLPRAVPRPGFWARFAHTLNSNWYKKEIEAFETNRRLREQISEQNQLAKEAWEAEAAKAKEETGDACRKVSRGLEEKFGALRTKDALASEKAAQQTLRQERSRAKAQAALDQAAAEAEKKANRAENAVVNMMSIFAPQPAPLPELVQKKIYTVESFSQLKPVTLPKDLQIGGEPVDDRLFANLAIHAQITEDVAIELQEQQMPDYRQKLRSEGLTDKEIEALAVHKAGGMVIGDVINEAMRPDLDQHFEKRMQPGRERAEAALKAYGNGDKAPLAEIIAAAAKYSANGAKEDEAGGQVALTDAKLTGELLDLLDRDPELAAAAREKGLTEKTVETCRGMEALAELENKAREADAKLLKARAEHRELSEQEKAECLKDIFKYRTADAMLKEQTAPENSKNFLTVCKPLDKRRLATELAQTGRQPMPADVKPLDSSICTDIKEMHYRLQMIPAPSVMKELADSREEAELAEFRGEEPKPDNLDKIAEMTVQGLGLDKRSTAELAGSIAGGMGPKGKVLLGEQGKLMAAREREKQQEEARERQLNDGVIYEPSGPHL